MQPHLNGTFHYLPVSFTRYTCILCMCGHAFHIPSLVNHVHIIMHAHPLGCLSMQGKQQNLGGLNNQKGDSLQTRCNSPSQTEKIYTAVTVQTHYLTFTV